MSDDGAARQGPFVQSRMFGQLLNPQHYGKCASCGFLSRSITIDSVVVIHEIPWLARDGAIPHEAVKPGEDLEQPYVECFLHVISILSETMREEKAAGDSNWAAAEQRVFWKERNCPEWFGYSPGLSPERHLERYEMQRLERDRRDFELKLATLTQQVQEDNKLILADSRALAQEHKELVAEIKDIARDMAISAKAGERFGKLVTFWIILLAIVQALMAIAALTNDSWIIKLLFPSQ